jgi:hypothetical protein
MYPATKIANIFVSVARYLLSKGHPKEEKHIRFVFL